MDHKAIQEQLFALYDGELTGPAREAVETHVAGCEECLGLVAQWTRVAGAFFRAPEGLAPERLASEAFVQRVMRRISAPRRAPRRIPAWILNGRWSIPALGLTAILLALMTEPFQERISVETLLVADGRDPVAFQRVLAGESPTSDEILGLLVEDAS